MNLRVIGFGTKITDSLTGVSGCVDLIFLGEGSYLVYFVHRNKLDGDENNLPLFGIPFTRVVDEKQPTIDMDFSSELLGEKVLDVTTNVLGLIIGIQYSINERMTCKLKPITNTEDRLPFFQKTRLLKGNAIKKWKKKNGPQQLEFNYNKNVCMERVFHKRIRTFL